MSFLGLVSEDVVRQLLEEKAALERKNATLLEEVARLHGVVARAEIRRQAAEFGQQRAELSILLHGLQGRRFSA